jgi:hypothetical protein
MILSISIMSVLSFTVAKTAESFRSLSTQLRQYFLLSSGQSSLLPNGGVLCFL